MAGTLMDAIKVMFARQEQDMKRVLTEDKIKADVTAIKNSNKDNSPELSLDEAVAHIKAKTTDPTRQVSNDYCEQSAHGTKQSEIYKNTLVNFGKTMGADTELLIESAKAVLGKKDTSEKAINNYAEVLSDGIIGQIQGINDEQKKIIRPQIMDESKKMVLATTEQMKEILSKNRTLAQEVANLPDPSKLGHLTPDDICIATTGNGVGRKI